jgi:hypothetical protein
MENFRDRTVFIQSEHGPLLISPNIFKRAVRRIANKSSLRSGIEITSPEYPELLLTRKELEKAQRAGRDSSKKIDRVRKLDIEDKAKSSKRLSRQRNARLLIEAKKIFYAKENQGVFR